MAERDETNNSTQHDDPIQDNDKRRDMRKKYRSIITDLQENRQELINPGSDELCERLREVDELYQPVQHAREARLDSQAVQLIANMARMQAQALHTDFVRFLPTEYAIKLTRFVGAGCVEEGCLSAKGWASFGKSSQECFKRSPPFLYMLGSFEREPKPKGERKPRAPRENDKLTAKGNEATQLNDFEKNDQGEATSEEVERILDILTKLYSSSEGSPIDYFTFVLNPDSFGHTVENIFYVSFLIRDGLAKVYLDDDGLPVIEPVLTSETSAKGAKENKKQQTVISITPKQWKELVAAYGIEEAQIKPRKSSQNRHG